MCQRCFIVLSTEKGIHEFLLFMQENGQSETKVFKATHMYAWAFRLAELLRFRVQESK